MICAIPIPVETKQKPLLDISLQSNTKPLEL